MNERETNILSKTVEAVTMISERLDVVFKAVEVIQKHIVDSNPKITYDTRIDMFKDNHSNDCKCNSCDADPNFDRWADYVDMSDLVEDVPFKSNKNPIVETFEMHREDINDNLRRLDRLEELVCVLIGIIKGPNDYLTNKSKEIYEEQAARGDFIDESDFVEDDINF